MPTNCLCVFHHHHHRFSSFAFSAEAHTFSSSYIFPFSARLFGIYTFAVHTFFAVLLKVRLIKSNRSLSLLFNNLSSRGRERECFDWSKLIGQTQCLFACTGSREGGGVGQKGNTFLSLLKRDTDCVLIIGYPTTAAADGSVSSVFTRPFTRCCCSGAVSSNWLFCVFCCFPDSSKVASSF